MAVARPRPPKRATGIILLGPVDGFNTTFTTPAVFLNAAGETIAVFYNGQRLLAGASADFVLSESGGPGTGWNTIQTLFTPRVGDVLTADYATPP